METRFSEQIVFDELYLQNFIPGKKVDPETGKLISDPGTSVIFEPVRVSEGAVIRSSEDGKFQVHYYTSRIREELIHTYKYDDESVYTYYLPGKKSAFFSAGPVTIEEDGFIRIVLEGITDAPFTDKIHITGNTSVRYTLTEKQTAMQQRITAAVEQQRTKDNALFVLLTDTHYGCGSNFEQTAFLLEDLTKNLHPDALIHLGDLTDGSLPGEWTKKFALRVIRSLKKICSPCFFLIGNHDYNYFKDNPDRFSQKECEELYLEGQKENRIIDLKDKKLRLIFLSTFDPAEKHRYGFGLSTVWFLIKALVSAPKGLRIIVLSHVPPLPEIHCWDSTIRHSGPVVRSLEIFTKIRKQVPVYIHGHNHCDQVYLRKNFPIIGIGPSKLEDFQIKKPEGSNTPLRDQYDETSALFDVLLVKEKELLFFRYGAGEDRTVLLDQDI